ncbi:MAG: efflux RND transporter permease subunit [Fusobacteriaceae bacterium]
MNISEFSIKRPVATMMIVLSMVILGTLVLINLKTELLPNYNTPRARIRTKWRGASPEDMEKLVTREIEKGLSKVEGIKRVRTQSTLGNSDVTVEFNYGEDIDKKVNDLVTAVNGIRNELPDEIDEPDVQRSGQNANSRVILLGITGKDLISLKIFADNIVVPKLEKINGVGSVEISGGDEREIVINIDPNKLEAYNLSINELYSLLKKSNINYPVGNIREGDKEYLVKFYGELKTLEDVKDIVLKNKNGDTLYLTDVANVSLGSKERETYGRTNGADNIIVTVEKTDTGNTLEISKAVKKEVKKLESFLPAGTKITINRDSAIDIINSIEAVKNNAFTGLILATIILLVFLKDFRATLVVAVAIPVSIIATFGFFGAKGMTLNMISLMGLSLGVGMLVDNSVVVLDNIFRHLTELKEDRMTASSLGASEVVVPIITSTATTVAVFIPIVLREGMAKEMYKDMAYSITFSLIASLIIALTFVPMVCSRILKNKNRIHEDGKILNFIKIKYEKLLKIALKNRVLTIGTAILMFLIFVIYGSSKIGGEFMPVTDDGVYTVIGEVPSGMDIEKSNKIALEFEKAIKDSKYTKQYTTSISKSAISVVVDIGFKNERENKKPISEITKEIRKAIINIPDVKLNVVPRVTMGKGASKDITLLLKSDNSNQLEYVTRLITEKISESSNIVDISNSLVNGNPEARLILDRKKLEYQGININDLGTSISYQILGGAPVKIKTDKEELDVTLQLDKKYRQSLALLMESRIKTSEGAVLKLKDVATLEIGEGPWGIEKEDKIITATIMANLTNKSDLVSNQKYISGVIKEMGIPQSMTYEFTGEGRSLKEVNEHLKLAFIVAIFLVYFILAAQFESYILPLIVMGSVPLAVTGVYIGLLVTGQKINTMVFVGIIMLSGIVVNNAIVLIDYVQFLLEKEGALYDSLIEAGKTRLRPILMTTMTTVFGMIPLSLGIGQGSERYIGMATAVIFGLTLSTLLTLILIPVLFEVYHESRKKLENKFYQINK